MVKKENLSVKTPEEVDDISNIDFLKRKGVEHLQSLSGTQWTDYNIHDPGITVLETLCFALTELGYRSKYSIEDLLQPSIRQKEKRNSNFPAHKILSSSPVTESDFRKIILEIEGINNIEIVPSQKKTEFNGVFDIYIELQNQYSSKSEEVSIERLVRDSLSLNRLLCTSFDQVFFFRNDPVVLDLEIELIKKIEPSDFLYKLVSLLEGYFSPAPHFKTLDELLEKKISVDEIYNGPLMDNGFIQSSELGSSVLRKHVYTSDILNIVMSLDGVHHTKKLKLRNDNGDDFNWIYEVKEGRVPRLDIKNSQVSITHKGKHSQTFLLKDYFSEMVSFKSRLKRAHKKNHLSPPKGEFRDLKEYYSITNDFPEVYGLSSVGMPEGSGLSEQASTRQLRVYLMFFDQIMVNYFAQLDHIKDLFSIEDIETTNAVQVLEGFPGIHFVYKPFLDEYIQRHVNLDDEGEVKKEWKKYINSRSNEIAEFIGESKEDLHLFQVRRNKILDHLIARFGYDFTSFEVLSMLSDSELISVKLNFLRELMEKGVHKSKGPISILDTPLRSSGFESYLYNRLGIPKSSKTFLTNSIKKLFSNNSKSKNALQLSFKAMDKSMSLNDLLGYGSSPDNFTITETQISIMGKDNNVLCEVMNFNAIDVNPHQLIASKLYELSRQSEGFYMLEHNLLSPSDLMRIYGFHVTINGVNVFSSDFTFSRSQRDAIVNSYLLNALNSSHYEIEEIDTKQYKILWSDKKNKIYSTHFFNSINDAKKGLKDYLNGIKILITPNEAINYSTEFSSFYNELNDPFSNIVSFICPSWPHRFQNEAFKNHIEETIQLETPAHIITNICWFDYEDMVVFENSMIEYSSCPIVKHAEHLKYLKYLLEQLTKK